MDKKIGTRIHIFREFAALSAEQVAARCKMTLCEYEALEEGKRAVTLEELLKVSKVLGVSVCCITEVIGWGDNRPVLQMQAARSSPLTPQIIKRLEGRQV